jgi:hypothetical protein
MADEDRVLWGVQIHVVPAAVPWPQPAVMNMLITAPTETQARYHALIAVGMLNRAVMVDPEYGSMVYAEAVPEVSG